jgi:hypothetical protein
MVIFFLIISLLYSEAMILSLTLGPVGLVEVRANWPRHPR